MNTTHEAAQASTRQVLEASLSWNDVPYVEYPAGVPQLTVVRYSIPPHSSLPWHTHSVPNAAYILDGAFTVEERDTGRTLVLRAGEAFAESVGNVHRGYTGDLPAEIVVTYAGAAGVPLTTPA